MNYLGSVKKLQYLPANSIPTKPGMSTIAKSAIESLSWQPIDFVNETASFKQSHKTEASGELFPTTVQCETAGQDQQGGNAGFPYIIWLTDQNGNDYLIGTKQTPLRLTLHDNTIPTKTTQRPGQTLKYQGTQLNPPIKIQ